ncbi:TonB-dependent receptor [Aquisalimonas asiatica]|uniref:Iron complex outermembrane recepter protein n=1 Tax=Aquisalimonas asiatica TaxID=406100 RepID=A0A1H8SYB1_9GAMM|nr:TonB-dependent receptor [Aquisalimonas asiatica]SEO83485.1 iron complex outermembrane recepter protein [Aquisalimonas asiatica]
MPATHSTAAGRSARKRSIIAFAVLTIGLQPTLPSYAETQDSATQSTRQYAISAGPLGEVLNTFADQTGLLLSGDASLTDGKHSAGLQGSHTPREGLDHLLADTGLQARFTDARTVALERSTDRASVQLDAVTVHGTLQSRYESSYADTLLRLPRDVEDTPRIIDVIPEQLLLDQQAREMADAYRFAPNVISGDGFGGTLEDYFIRGFRRSENIYRNGVPLNYSGRIDPATVDSIQVLKGPSADIGRMPPGGLINVETKRPEYTPRGSVSTMFDEHGQRRAVADLTGPAGDNFAYRVTTAAEDSDTFRDSTVDRQFISSSLSWLGSSGISLDLNHEYSRDRRDLDRGFVTVPRANSRRRIASGSPDKRFDDPGLNERDAEYHLVELDLHVPLADPAWAAETKLLYVRETSDDIRVEVNDVSESGELTRTVTSNQDRERATAFARLQLTGELDYRIPTRLAIGTEFRQDDLDHTFAAGAPQTGGTVRNPGSHTIVNDIDNPSFLSDQETTQRNYGIFATTAFDLTENLALDLGLRYEAFSGTHEADLAVTGESTRNDPSTRTKLTKGAGLLWQVAPQLALFTNYADTFEPQSLSSGDSRVVSMPPEEGRQYEIGVRWRSPEDGYHVTTSVFDIRQDNVVETVDGDPQLTGEVSSRGAEVSVVAAPAQGFNLRGAVGVLDTEINSNNATTHGNRPGNVPTLTGHIWASYEIQNPDSPLRGLGMGAGLTHVGDRYGDNAHTWSLGSYTLVDAGLWYYLPLGERTRLRLDAGVKNLTDERHFTASGGNFRVAPGAPRTVFGSARLEF